MELRPISDGIVHGEEREVFLLRALFAGRPVDAWRRRREEALRGADARLIVHQREGRMLSHRSGDARSAVCFITDHQVEGRRAIILRFSDALERLVGTEDHRQLLRRALA